MIPLPDYIFLEGTIYFRFKSNKPSNTLLKDLEEKLKKKRFPINIWIYNDTTLCAKITYLIEDHDTCGAVRSLVGACITKDELIGIISELFKSELLLKTGYEEHEIQIEYINYHKESGNKINLEKVNSDTNGKMKGKKWKIPKKIFLKKMNMNYKERKSRFENKDFQYEMSYFKLPCVKPLLVLGGISGKRNFGAKVIAFACKSEGLTKDEAKIVSKYYHDRINSPDFPLEEILNWIDWIYKIDGIHWSCRTPQDMGLCDKSVCWIVKDYYRKREYYWR